MTPNEGDAMRRDPFLLTPGPLTTRDRPRRRCSTTGAPYPGKLTVADSFRIGCIGRLGEAEMRGVLDAIRDILAEMGVTRCAPAAAEPAGARLSRTI